MCLMCVLYSVNSYLQQSCIAYRVHSHAPSIRSNRGTAYSKERVRAISSQGGEGGRGKASPSRFDIGTFYALFYINNLQINNEYMLLFVFEMLIKFSLFICLVFWKSSLHGDHRTSFCLLAVSSVVHFCS